MEKGLIAIGAGIAVFTGFMTGLGEGTVAAHACDAIGRIQKQNQRFVPQ